MSAKPVVYFIDDSATMREVIKIAFRREDLEVITCHDASSAMDLMDHSAPDVVITDVIMPGRDGYDVCQYIKQHPRFGQTPVILMSGVVNKGVAERAFAVHANELIRKPFQPQDLIARVRHLLAAPVEAEPPNDQAYEDASAVLNSIFSGPMPCAQRSRSIAHQRTGPGAPRGAPRTPAHPVRCLDCRHGCGRADAAGGGTAGLHSRCANHRLGTDSRAAAPARTSSSSAHIRQQFRAGKNAAGNPPPAQPDQETGGGVARRTRILKGAGTARQYPAGKRLAKFRAGATEA